MSKIYLFAFVLLFTSSDSVLAARHYWFHRHARCLCVCHVKSDEADYRLKALFSDEADYCLKALYMDFGGPNLYQCFSYDLGCDNDNGYDDFWSGYPSTSDFPETCLKGNCEVSMGIHRGAGGPPPGHESLPGTGAHSPFATKQIACDWLNKYYAGGNPHLPCHYYSVPDPSHPGNYYYVVIVQAPAQNPLQLPRDFGVETVALIGETVDNASYDMSSIVKHGHVLSFKYSLGPSQWHKALVWLR